MSGSLPADRSRRSSTSDWSPTDVAVAQETAGRRVNEQEALEMLLPMFRRVSAYSRRSTPLAATVCQAGFGNADDEAADLVTCCYHDNSSKMRLSSMVRVALAVVLLSHAAVTQSANAGEIGTWRDYVNAKYAYAICYPADLLRPQGESDAGDGQAFLGDGGVKTHYMLPRQWGK